MAPWRGRCQPCRHRSLHGVRQAFFSTVISNTLASHPDSQYPPPQSPAWQICIGRFSPEQVRILHRQPWPTVLLILSPDREGGATASAAAIRRGTIWQRSACLAKQDGEAIWYRYNDSRYDGLNDPDAINPPVPNLQLLDHVSVYSQRLDRLLEDWRSEDPELAELLQRDEGSLWLQTLQPAAVIQGLGTWLQQLVDIHWTPPCSLHTALAILHGDWSEWLQADFHQSEVLYHPISQAPRGAWFCWRKKLPECIPLYPQNQQDQIRVLWDQLQRLQASHSHLQRLCDDLSAECDRLRSRLHSQIHGREFPIAISRDANPRQLQDEIMAIINLLRAPEATEPEE